MLSEQAYVELVERHRPAMLRLARHRLRLWHMAEADAEDYVQTALVKMWEYRHDVTETEYVESLFNTVLLAEIISACRRKARVIDPYAAELLYLHTLPADDLTDLTEAVEAALATIPDPKTRTAAWLVYCCEFTVKDAAQVLGLDAEALKTRLRRAAPRLRAQLENYTRQGGG